MVKRSTILHLRIPFSYFLLPFFLFALSQSDNIHWIKLVLSFLAINLFFNPASNGYNSYFDKDTESIGGLKHPPEVTKELYYTSLVFDFIALILAAFVNSTFFIMLLILGFISKAYSHPSVRLKKYAVGGLITVAFFQGAWTYLMSYAAINDLRYYELLHTYIVFPAAITSCMLLGTYPMTQIYQHGEDSRRGDHTFSLLMGVRGTFLWTLSVFGLATGLFITYFILTEQVFAVFLLMLCSTPTILYFLSWYIQFEKGKNCIDFERTMWLNILSATGFNVFFLLVLLIRYI